MIELHDITKTFLMGNIEVNALRGVSLQIDDGEFVAIMGPSGSGKSTLMNILGCLDTPTTGVYLLDGQEVSGLSDDQLAHIRNEKIGFVFQSFNLLPRMAAVEQVELPLAYANVSHPRELAVAALESVGLGDRIHHKPTELSGGQQQRVAIARALVTSPRIIFADEPTGNLDSKASREIMEIFEQLHAEGITIVFVTHEPDVAAHAQRVLFVRDGLIESDRQQAPVTVTAQRATGTGTAAAAGSTTVTAAVATAKAEATAVD